MEKPLCHVRDVPTPVGRISVPVTSSRSLLVADFLGAVPGAHHCRSLPRFFRRLTKLPGDVRVVTNTFAGPPSASSYRFTGVLTAATPVLPCPCRVSNISQANHSQAQVSCTVAGFLRERVLPVTGHRLSWIHNLGDIVASQMDLNGMNK
ncbi:uncharacterized protein LOC130139871 [Syzygium oleosum]|uniref:uncharacterized protein LOC130139871 n=1 Tax=Syzygium oleosum TaxID=219896 RepID=UPI0024B927A8|nr:uncharacterized protein LOC130139871 [Syzygium oleosum]